LRDRFTDLLALYKRLYTSGSYGAVRSGDLHRVGGRIRGLCQQYGITGRMPRPIIPGDSSPSVLAPTLVRLQWFQLEI
jgi:hypothetical protein